MNDPRRVAFVVDSPTYGGAERCIAQLVRGLPPTVARAVLATEPVPWQLASAVREAGWPMQPLPPVRGTARGAAQVADAVAALRPDVVHVNLIDPATCLDVLRGALAGGRCTVADVHMTGTIGDGEARRPLRLAYRDCAAVIGRSLQIGELVRVGFAVPAGRVHVVRNGAPVRAAVAATGPRPGPVRIRAVGRLTRQKGFDLLVDATRRLLAAGFDIDVAVAGDGRDRDALAVAARGLPVRLAGFVSDVPAFLADADIFCLPSRAEGLPLALLEAVLAGLPCVACDVGDVAAALADLAIVIPPEDVDALTAALAALAADPTLRAELGRRARREGVARFDERTTVAAVGAVYRSALAVGAA